MKNVSSIEEVGLVYLQCIAERKELKQLIYPIQEVYRQLNSYSLTSPSLYARLDSVISTIIKEHKNIVIYPYGRNRKICKEVLNDK